MIYLITRFSPMGGTRVTAIRKYLIDAKAEARGQAREALACDIFFVSEVPEMDKDGPLRNVWQTRGKHPIE